MDYVFIQGEALFLSILLTKTKYDKPTYGMSNQEWDEIDKAFTEHLKSIGINVWLFSVRNWNYFGYMHWATFVYEGVDLEELAEKYKNNYRYPKEISDLIWNEDFICEIANINKSKNIIKK